MLFFYLLVAMELLLVVFKAALFGGSISMEEDFPG